MAKYTKAKLTVHIVSNSNFNDQRLIAVKEFDLNNIEELSKKAFDPFLGKGSNTDNIKVNFVNVRDYGLVVLVSSKKGIVSEKVSLMHSLTLTEEIDKTKFLAAELIAY